MYELVCRRKNKRVKRRGLSKQRGEKKRVQQLALLWAELCEAI